MGDVRVNEDVVTQVVQTAVLRPGDTLIVRVRQDSSLAFVEQFMAAVRERLPDVPVVLIGAEELAVYRPEKLHNVELAPPNVDELAKSVAEGIGRQTALRRRTG